MTKQMFILMPWYYIEQDNSEDSIKKVAFNFISCRSI